MPASTSVKSRTASPEASCRRTISRPLMVQPVMSLVKGRAAAQAGSSSTAKPCGVLSGFNVNTQVLLRSVVESSHFPTPSMVFFRDAASCDRAGDPATIGISRTATARPKRNVMNWPLNRLCQESPMSAGLHGGLRNWGQRRLAGKPRLQIVHHELVHRVARYHGSRANMWQQDDILHGLQLVRHVRLPLEYVETGGKDGPGLQRRDQRLLIDHAAARDIDDHAAGTERLHDIGIDHLCGRGAAGHDDNKRIDRLGHLDQVAI